MHQQASIELAIMIYHMQEDNSFECDVPILLGPSTNNHITHHV